MTTDGDLDHNTSHTQPEAQRPLGLEIGDLDAGLTLTDIVQVARDFAPVAPLTAATTMRIEASARWVEELVKGVAEQARTEHSQEVKAYYGINTGFGALAGRTALSNPALIEILSRNLIASHSIGVGAYFEEEVVRAAMLLRAHSLAQGYSGVRPVVVETLIETLNKRVYPAIPSKGSLGASGDLAPLSHLALVLSKPPAIPQYSSDEFVPHYEQLDHTSGEAFLTLAEPLVEYDLPQESGESVGVEQQPYHHVTENRKTGRQTVWRRVSGEQAMSKVGVPRLVLRAKEGLAFNNGATFSAALAAITLVDACNVFDHAELALALSLEGMRGFRDPFLPAIHRVRGHEGAKDTAARVLQYVAGSSLLDGDASHDPKRIPPQDPYSLRCAPQVLGSVLDTLRFVRRTVEVEINAVTDNPLIFLDNHDLNRGYRTVSGGNFHGEPLAFAMDYLGIAMTELGNIAERRVFKMTDYHFSSLEEQKEYGLPDFLLEEPERYKGLSSGYMIAQYTAASLISDCKTLAHPDSVDSIPSSADKEDHVSMSLNAARHAREIVDNVEAVIAIELMCAVQAIDLQQQRNSSLKPGRATGVVRARIREQVSYLAQDRVLYPDLRMLIRLIRSGSLTQAARAAGEEATTELAKQ